MTCLFHYSSLCGIRNNVKRDPLRYVKSNGEDTNESKEEGGEKEKIEGGVGEEKRFFVILSDSCLRGSPPIGPMTTTEENQLEQAVLCCVDPAVNPTVRKQVQPPFYLGSLLECTQPHLITY